MRHYGRQTIDEADIQAVTDVLRSDRLTQGEVTPAFERAVAGYCGAKHAIAVTSGTAALHVAMLVLKPDTVWTSPITFVVTAAMPLLSGASVRYVDIDPDTLNLGIGELADMIERHGPPDVVIPVHFAGQPCEMDALYELAKQYGFSILEDACHALGAEYEGEKVGSCKWSDFTCFSFHPVKSITTGEGGMLLTNDDRLAASARRWADPHTGFNYRMSDINAALGLSQLAKLDHFIEVRNLLADRYDEAFADTDVKVQRILPHIKSARHIYPVQTDKELDAVLHYPPLAPLPNAVAYAKRAKTLPLYPSLTPEEQDAIIERVLG